MASLLLPLLVAVLIPLLLLLKARRFPGKKTTSSKLPPGPPPLPLIGNLHLLGRLPHLSLRRLSLTYGPILHLSLGETPTVVLSSASAAREALRTNDLPLASRPPIYAAKKLFYGCSDIAFAPYGPYWRRVRKLCILELLSNRRVDSYAPARAAEVALMLSRISSAAAADGGAVNLSKVLGMYANGVLCRAAFGRDFVEGGDYEKRGFESMLHEYQVLLGGFSLGDFIPSLEWLNTVTGMKRRLEKTFRRFDEFFDQIIEEHMERRRRKKEEHDEGDEDEAMDLVDVLLDAQEKETTELPLTMDNVKAVILDMFAAGTDTTFITLDWAMTELLMNPCAMKRAQAEVRSIVGGGGRKLVSEADDLPRMPYLKAVIKEVFRLHPPAPLLVPRESMEAVTIEGYEIPAKTRVFVNAWAIGRDPDSWEHPDAFAPERFLHSPIDFKGQDFELIPFGAGRRGCPAMTFGTASVEIALTQLLHDFDWELPPGVKAEDLDMDEVFGITMHRREELVAIARLHGGA